MEKSIGSWFRLVALLIASIPSLIIKLIDQSLVTSIVIFLLYCFIDGFISKNVAVYWEEEGVKE